MIINGLIIMLYTYKSAVSGMPHFLTTKISFKMIRNAFYFILEAFFVLKIYKFLS